jgi:hypothetical protein
MSASRILLACAFLLSLGACHRDRCLSVCQQREKELGCKPTPHTRRTCKDTCDELHEASPCSEPMRAWEACLVTVPASAWECTEVGPPAPKDGECTKAKVGVIECIQKFPEWPPPKKK